ncbi:MAG: hypothetical protein QOG80_1295 [Pseudonocardiales bacterium]|nr:hypothetical protein [Pseudonocardiales bacterium]
MVTEDELRRLSKEELAELSRSLANITADLPSLNAGDQRRRRFVIITTIATLGLIPWVILLAVTLPKHYIVGHWTLTWVGFDIGLLGALGLTAYLAWRRRQAVIVLAFIASVLLICDAWFDITTSSGTADVAVAVASAALVELPLAALLFAVAYHLLGLALSRSRIAQDLTGAPRGLFKVTLFGVPERADNKG